MMDSLSLLEWVGLLILGLPLAVVLVLGVLAFGYMWWSLVFELPRNIYREWRDSQ